MFDISFGEILLIGVVALVVLGPERLPTVARTLGALVARAQRFVASVKDDIGQHAELANLTALKQEVQQTAAAFHAKLSADVDEVKQSIHQVRDEAVEGAPIDAVTLIEPSPPHAELSAPVNNPNQLDLFTDSSTVPTWHESSR